MYFYLALGVIFSAVFIIFAIKGQKYAPSLKLDMLDDNEFPLKDLYCEGFALSRLKPLRLKGKLASTLRSNALMLYEPAFSEYYANIVWAQTLTFVNLILAVFFMLAAIMYKAGALMVVSGLFMAALTVSYCLEKMKTEIKERTEECESQLPEVVSTMAVLINSGMRLGEAWATIGEKGSGAIYELMRKATQNMKNGYTQPDAIYQFGQESNSPEVRKFVSALMQSMEKDASDLASFLINQSTELWNAHRQTMLQKGEAAAGKLLAPIVLIFVGVIIIVITAAFAGSLFA